MSKVKVFGIRGSLIGDLIMALPIIEYLKEVHGDIDLTWVVHKNCQVAAPLFINHPNISRIYVSQDHLGLTSEEIESAKKTHGIVFNTSPPVRDQNWRNEMDCISQTARMAGIDDFDELISDHRRIPKLYRWFSSYSFGQSGKAHGYTTARSQFATESDVKMDSVAIWPFANYMLKPQRSPSEGWWGRMCEELIEAGYHVYHYGWVDEPMLMSYNNPFYHRMCDLSFFDQIRSSLEAPISIGTDSGSMWVLGAYGQKTLCLMTYHEYGHHTNPEALKPPYENCIMLFNPRNINLIRHNDVLCSLK